ncbi:glycosyltransferase [Sedimenticola hydrogenitrophicus]|uniref:glycosyltransferase n=1 Tax=Sedimenticola hydrogenitrophicus TaxID=2967975 RepID=UPI0021A8E2BB|nr:nucleotide disphospho-sugar-binding domain-containing protein [Sedimenticola hydrogenitrophicus]
MGKVLCAWELGSAFGHLGRFRRIADQLAAHGHEVDFALRELGSAELMLGRTRFRWFQAPMLTPAFRPRTRPCTYTEILLQHGYADPLRMTGQVNGWLALMEAVRPDLVMLDYAPTAHIAAIIAGIPTATVSGSGGFVCLPRVSPVPAYYPQAPNAEKRAIQAEYRVLKSVNSVLKDYGSAPLEACWQLTSSNRDFLCTLPEADVYADLRTEKIYYPFACHSSEFLVPSWHPAARRKIFAYLKSYYRDLPELIRRMSGCADEVKVFVSEGPGAQFEIPENVEILNRPANLGSVVEACDVVVCHAGNETVMTTLLGGKPLLLIPLQMEQWLVARQVVRSGAGLMVNLDSQGRDAGELLTRLFDSASFRDRAGTAASSGASGPGISEIIEGCETLLSAS